MKIEKTDKIFTTWKKLKHIVFMCILNTLLKQIMIIKTQDTIFNYAKMLKMKSNLIVKIVFKWIKHEIMILWCECSFFNEKEIKSTKIVKIMNIKIEDNDKKNDNSKKIS